MTMIRKELIREKCRKYLLCRGSGKARLQDFRKGGGEWGGCKIFRNKNVFRKRTRILARIARRLVVTIEGEKE